MKTCGECGRNYPIEAVVCFPCGEILENRLYLRFIGVASLFSVLAVWLLARTKLLESFSWSEPFMYVAFLCLTIYPGIKLVQKLRDPRRPVLREMGSIYTDRSDRAVVLIAVLAVLFAISGMPAFRVLRGVPVHPDYQPIRAMIIWTIGVGGPLACLAMIADQGLAFFDPRIKNTYLARYSASQADQQNDA